MPEKCIEHEVADFLNFCVCEDEDAVWGPLAAVPEQNVFEHFDPIFVEKLSFDHGVEDEIHDG